MFPSLNSWMFLRPCLHAFVLWIWNKSTVLFDSSPYELGKGLLDFLGHWFFVVTVSRSLSFYFGTTFLPSTFWHFLYLWGGTNSSLPVGGHYKTIHLNRFATRNCRNTRDTRGYCKFNKGSCSWSDTSDRKCFRYSWWEKACTACCILRAAVYSWSNSTMTAGTG